jgi:tetratricopeptide (TPR) repeat protein
LNDSVLQELNIRSQDIPKTDAAERLVWFFRKIEHYGSPLVIWTNAAPCHMRFLHNVELSSTLTFLLMYGPQPAPTLIDLVNENQLEEAQKACATLPDPCGDDLLSAAYWAFARSEDSEESLRYIRRVSSKAEKLLLIANFISRRGIIPNPRPDWMLHHPDGKLTNLQQQHCQEDCFRNVISDPGDEAPMRESGRAKHELGYLLQSVGMTSVAEMLYGQALADLEKCPEEQHDYRWHDRLGRLLRDWADLLAQSPDRLDKARELLNRAMAIHSFHGRRLQIAYCLDTAARVALTGRRFSEAIQKAVDSANLFEVLKNWRGWGEAMKVLFDCLAETRETARMHSVADLAIDKLQTSNLPHEQRDRLRRAFIYEKANANWIAGKLAEARSELEKLGLGSADAAKVELDPEFEAEVKRLWRFLALNSQ